MYSVEESVSPPYVPLQGIYRGLNRAARRALQTGDFDVEPHRKIRGRSSSSYRTVFGPAFAHSGVVYATNRRNLGTALYRLFHDKSGVQALNARQEVVCESRTVVDWAALVSWGVGALVGQNRDPGAELKRAAFQPHPKRVLREQAYQDIFDLGAHSSDVDPYMFGRNHMVKLKLKPLEWGKPKKYGRIVCDLGTPASLRAGLLFETIKKVMASTPLEGEGFSVFVVADPNVERLTLLFRELRERCVALVFSDDMALSVPFLKEDGSVGFLYYEIDISGCDASQGPAVWKLASRCVPSESNNLFEAVVNQALTPCVVGHGEEKMKFQPLVPREYSGILATTVLNNCASVTIAFQLLQDFPLLGRAESEAELNARLVNCGWSCTLVRADRFERLTFLKHSPIMGVDGQYYATLNLGVVLRALGQKSYDLPGRGCLKQRANAFNAGLISGMKHSGNHSLMKLLRNKFPLTVPPVYNSGIIERVTLGEVVLPDLLDESIVRRYDIEVADFHHLLGLLEVAGFGDVISCHASQRILEVDYGL